MGQSLRAGLDRGQHERGLASNLSVRTVGSITSSHPTRPGSFEPGRPAWSMAPATDATTSAESPSDDKPTKDERDDRRSCRQPHHLHDHESPGIPSAAQGQGSRNEQQEQQPTTHYP